MRAFLQSLILSSIIAAPMATLAAVPTYSNLYVFGDSYCDVGNLFAASGGTVPGAPYYMGRFSNGPLWVDHVAGFLGLPMKPALLGGTNYAFAGAEVTTASNIGGATIPSVPQQVELYLSQHGGKADPMPSTSLREAETTSLIPQDLARMHWRTRLPWGSRRANCSYSMQERGTSSFPTSSTWVCCQRLQDMSSSPKRRALRQTSI